MPGIGDWRPMLPWEGPPFPRLLRKAAKPQKEPPIPNGSAEKIPQRHDSPPEQDDEYVIVLKKKGKTPTWLSEYQSKLSEARRVAAERTKHLKGIARVRAMNQITGEIIKRG